MNDWTNEQNRQFAWDALQVLRQDDDTIVTEEMAAWLAADPRLCRLVSAITVALDRIPKWTD